MPHEQQAIQDDELRPEQRIIQDVLETLPFKYRVAHLVWSVTCDNAVLSIEVLIGIAMIMAKRLPPEQRAAVVWHLNEAASELKARWQ